jgi:hypothetical protein
VQWLSDITSEAEKFTSKCSFLLPKTPAAKRKLRKRRSIATIPEDGMLNV